MTNHAPRPDIAIIGASALFPGSLDSTGFWHDVLASRDLISDVPASHWLHEDYYDADPKAMDKTYAKRGAFLGDVDFDALAWGVPPSIVPATDTSQLLALIVAHKVLEDAANGPIDGIDKSRMSCILGVTSAQELLGTMVSRLQRPVWVKALREHGLGEAEVKAVADRISNSYVPWQEATFPGLLGNVVAGRIANRLDLGGTNCVTDAACASTFSALQMGVNELYLGDSDVVIAGGVDTMNDIFMYMCFSKTPALSASGDVRPFSDQADGTMLGEGLAMFALKRLPDAERDGDRIWAVIRGVGSSSDGRAKSVYAPLPSGQAKAIRRAYEIAGYGPDTVELVEAHGTGTKAGDAAEFEGLRMVFDESGRTDRNWCALGSVKSQIGHTKAAAGAAGLFKAVMAVRHGALPPTIKVDRPNPKMDIGASAFHVNTVARPWVRGRAHARRAGVSSFGFGGSNFHLAVEEYTGEGRKPRLNSMGAWLVLLSGGTGESVAAEAEALANDAHAPGFLPWLSHDTVRRFDRTARARLALVATDGDDLAAKLRDAAGRIRSKGKAFSKPDGTAFGLGTVEGKVAFLFPGQGSQYVGMGSAVAMNAEPALAAWDAVADIELGEHRLQDVVYPRPVFTAEEAAGLDARITATEWAQPAIGVTSQAYLAVARATGLVPDAVAGHSYGEVTALHAAGCYDAETMVRIARKRGELMRDAAGGDGTMTAVARPADEVQAALEQARVEGVVLANHNHPTQVILSGPTAAIEAAEKALDDQGITCRRLNVATAFHSSVVAPAESPFRAFLQDVPGTLPEGAPVVYANTTAAPYTADDWRDTLSGQITRPVRWVELVERMHADGVRHFIEVGPGSVLGGLVKRTLRKADHTITSLDKKGKDGWTALLHGLAQLAVAGVLPDPAGLLADHAVPTDPRTLPQPKLKIPINGSNHGKPYPPAGGAAALPAPLSQTRPERIGAPVSPTPAAPPTHVGTPSAPIHPPASLHPGALPRPATLAETTMSNPPKPPSAPVPVAVQPAVGAHDPTRAAWIQAYQEAQRQAAQAHAAFQQAMADSHAAFLRTAETGFVGLATMVGGQPMPTAAPAFIAPPQPVAPPPVAPVATPASVVPSPPMAAAPIPVPVAPVAAAPVAPAPVAPAPAAPAPAALAPVAAAPGTDLTALLLTVVADKTGYPADMLDLGMDLEGDLGVDSIKRVEILSAMQDQAPDLPEVDPGEMAQLRTLGQIVDKLGGAAAATAPAATAAAPVAAAPGTDLTALLLTVVADKTGYPADMLDLGMDLEGDLGVDSIKRVEILSAMQDQAPDLPEVDPGEMAQLRTLGQIVDKLGGAAAAAAPAATAAAPTGPAAAIGSIDLKGLLLEVVAEKTGYPADMLDLGMDLEGDLGVDSIKRVEILSAMQDKAPDLPEVDPGEMAKLRTLGQIVDKLGEGDAVPFVDGSTDHASASVGPVAMPDNLGRFTLSAVPAPATGLSRAGIVGADPLYILDGGSSLAAPLSEALVVRGVRAVAAEALPEGATAAVFLGGLAPLADIDAACAVNHAAFAAAKALGTTATAFVTVQDTGGCFGLSDTLDPVRAWSAGLAALARTAAIEWPTAAVKAIDIERAGRDAASLAAALADELVSGGAALEVGLTADGGRVTLADTREPPTPTAPTLDPGDVVVVSGGARGVTAATVVGLARDTGARFVLLGRTALAAEPPAARGAETDADLKRALMLAARAAGETPNPRALGREVKAILAGREIRATLAAVEAAGGTARYVSVDVTDRDGVHAALAQVREDWGPVTGLIHGAGVIADKEIARKPVEDFAWVFDVKIGGLRSLLDATAGDPLKVLVMFASVAARCGNNGQADYAMANEVLNKVAEAERRRRGGQCLVKSLGWGPWEGGMVSPQLKARFEQLGVALIPLDVGAQMLVDELRGSNPAQVGLVLGGEPRPEALLHSGGARTDRYAVTVSPTSHPWLADHTIQGTPVVPVVLVVEWFARAAAALRTDLHVQAVEDVKVLGGVRLDAWPGDTRLEVEVTELSNGTGSTVQAVLFDGGSRRRYAATIRLAAAAPAASTWTGAGPTLADWGDRDVYGDVLFHGPELRVIRTVEGAGEAGIAAALDGVTGTTWPGGPWATDVAAFDGGLQLALLWGRDVLGGPTLPTGIGQVRLHTDGPVTGPLRGVLTGRSAGRGKAVSDIAFIDTQGRLVAELQGVETHALPSRA